MISIMQFGHSLVFLLITSSNAFSLVTHTSNIYRFQTQTTKTSSSSLHVSSFSPDENMSPDVSDADNKNLPHTHIQINSRQIEFTDLGSIQQSSERQQRIEQEQENRQRFMKYGDDLWELRESMEKLSVGLLEAIDGGEREKEEEIRQELRQIGKEDPDLVYKFELEQLQKALMEGREGDARIHSMLASAARSCLPQYNLDGLWVGKYGQHGYEMINVTYVGDQLIAYKVTGDKSVPRGEITFQADLNPLKMKNVIGNDPSSGTSTSTEENLEPINLTPYAAEKWGTSQLPRHKGLGQVAETGFNNNQWMDGQLIIIGEEYFSFAWVPIEQQIFFGRPSPELALKMLREIGAAAITPFKSWEEPPTLDSDVNVLKDYVSSCLEKTTESVEEEMGGDAFGCIWTGGETDESYFQ